MRSAALPDCDGQTLSRPYLPVQNSELVKIIELSMVLQILSSMVLQILLLSAAATAFVSPHERTRAPASALRARTRAPASALRAVPAQDWTAGCETFTWESYAIRYCKSRAAKG